MADEPSESSELNQPAFTMCWESPPEFCPICNGIRFAKLLYGFPRFNEEMFRALNEGEIMMGGAILEQDSYSWHCHGCGHEGGSIVFEGGHPCDYAQSDEEFPE